MSGGSVSAAQAFGAPQQAMASAAAPATPYAAGFPGYIQSTMQQAGYPSATQPQPTGGINPITGQPY